MLKAISSAIFSLSSVLLFSLALIGLIIMFLPFTKKMILNPPSTSSKQANKILLSPYICRKYIYISLYSDFIHCHQCLLPHSLLISFWQCFCSIIPVNLFLTRSWMVCMSLNPTIIHPYPWHFSRIGQGWKIHSSLMTFLHLISIICDINCHMIHNIKRKLSIVILFCEVNFAGQSSEMLTTIISSIF